MTAGGTVTRVLVAGSRDWPEPDEITGQLDHVHATFGEMLLVHGAATRGGDAIADRRSVDAGPWRGCGASPGHVAGARRGVPGRASRNGDLQAGWDPPQRRDVVAGADLCLVFIHNGSAGSTHTMRTATAVGIPTWVFVPGQPPHLQAA